MARLEIEYCAPCGYEKIAVGLTEKLLLAFKQRIDSLVLIPSSGERFEVTIDGKLVFSKLEKGRFPQFEEIRALLE
jgi:selenoprotein W-related protein